MPIYEYQCDSCGTRREIILKPGAVARPLCQDCRRRMRRMISPTAFILKGAGWYVTDYPSADRKQGLEGEKPPAPPPPAADAAEKKGPAPVEKKPVKKKKTRS